MLKTFLLWLLRDEIIDIAAHQASKVVGVIYDPYETSDENAVAKVFLKKGGKRIFINDFTVEDKARETFSAPTSVQIGGMVIDGTANFEVTEVETEDDKVSKPIVSVEIEEKRKESAKEVPWYYHDVLRLLNAGLSDHEIYKKTYMSITSVQLYDALGWAKLQVAQKKPAQAVTPKKKRGRSASIPTDAIADDLKSGKNVSEVVALYGVSPATVYRIKSSL